MDLAINKVLVAPPLHSRDKNPARFTVVDYEYGSDIVVLCQQDRKSPKKPFVHKIGSGIKVRHSGTTQLIRDDLFEVQSQNFRDADHVRAFRDLKHWKNQTYNQYDKTIERYEKLEKRVIDKWRVVEKFEQIETRKIAFFNGRIPTASIKAFAKSLGVSYDFVWDTLSTYYAFGQIEEALIPTYSNCGKNASLPKNCEDAAKIYPTGRGRRRAINDSQKRPSNQQDLDNVKAFYNRKFNGLKYLSFTHLCSEFNAEYATELIYEDDYGRKIYDYVPERFLTLSQFKTLLRRACGSKAKFDQIKHGSKEFRNKFKTLTSSVLKHVVGPGHMYEIDATVLDVHLVSQFCTEEVLPVGRPILYSVVDVATNMIVGFHLSLNGANAESVSLALFNAMSDKEKFCKQWGYDYREGDWPCRHVCHSLVIDRGSEYLDDAMARLVKQNIGIASIQVTEAYLGRAKGSVEGLFNKLNKKRIHALPGALLKGKAKAKKDPSKNAILTIADLYYILIDEIIAHNNTTPLQKKRTQEHLAYKVKPLPRELWNWGIEELMDGGTIAQPKSVMSALLPRKLAKVNRQGVTLIKDKITYQTKDQKFEEFRQDMVVEKKRSDYEIEVMVLPSWNQQVWLQMGNDANDIITFELADTNAELKNLHFAEAFAILEEQSVFESQTRYSNSVDDALRTKNINGRIAKNRERLRSLSRSEGKSAAQGTNANRKVDEYHEAQNNAATVCSALNDSSDPQAINNRQEA